MDFVFTQRPNLELDMLTTISDLTALKVKVDSLISPSADNSLAKPAMETRLNTGIDNIWVKLEELSKSSAHSDTQID